MHNKSNMNIINISVNVKDNPETVNMVLFRKIYSTPYGILNHWSTRSNSEFRLEILIDKDDVSVNPSKITKSMEILTNEWEIADQMMLELNENKDFQMQNLNNVY